MWNTAQGSGIYAAIANSLAATFLNSGQGLQSVDIASIAQAGGIFSVGFDETGNSRGPISSREHSVVSERPYLEVVVLNRAEWGGRSAHIQVL